MLLPVFPSRRQSARPVCDELKEADLAVVWGEWPARLSVQSHTRLWGNEMWHSGAALL
jgi:hypothetical protein